jgi:lipoate-protein ligase A
MAVDHALAEGAAESLEGVVRFYRWSPPTISFGRNEPAVELYDASTAAERGIAFVRRPTGGRAVLHDRELTYAVTVPLTGRGDLRGLYRDVNKSLSLGLRRLGAEVALFEGGDRPPGPDEGPCFRLPVGDELTWRGRKLVGSAQARIGGAVLQHGSLLMGGSQDAVAELRGETPERSRCPRLLKRSLPSGRFRTRFEGGSSRCSAESGVNAPSPSKKRQGRWSWRSGIARTGGPGDGRPSPRVERSMMLRILRQGGRWCLLVMVLGACGGDAAREPVPAGPWSLDRTILDAGRGNAFCEAARPTDTVGSRPSARSGRSPTG